MSNHPVPLFKVAAVEQRTSIVFGEPRFKQLPHGRTVEDCLKEIGEEGERVLAFVIITASADNEYTPVYYSSTANRWELIGQLERVKHLLIGH